MRDATAILVAGVLALGMATAATAADTKDERDRAERAAQVLTEMMRAEDTAIPEALLERAKAIAVVPHMVKGAFVVGGQYGKGLVTARGSDGTWGPASFIEMSGASFGFQIGGEAIDVIMVFIEEDGLEALLTDKVQLGADVSLAAGPLGRTVEAGTNLTLDSAIYAYSRTKGLFAGAAIDGAALTIDDSANHETYASEVTGRQILIDGVVDVSEVTKPFVDAVRHLTPPVAK